jgi:tetratricopeptide (TPR) repeat protein
MADPTSLAAALHYLGNLAWTRGDFAEAERTYQRVLEIRERYLGPEHTEVGDSLQSLAVALILQDREREALPYYARAREIFERRLGAEHPRVARVLEGVAAVHARTGELEAAEVAYRHSLAIHGAATGADGLNAGIAMGNVGRVVAMQGRFGEAIEIGERSVEIVARHTSPRTSAWVEGTLAESYRLAGRFDHAADAFERSLALREQVLPPGHPGLAEALTGLAEARIGQGRPEEARDLLERAVELLESQGDDERADLVAARARLTEVRAQLAERGKTARP